MATLSYNSTTKQFTLSYSYTNANGKTKEVSAKPRSITSLSNQILKAQGRGITTISGSVSSQELSALDAVVTVSNTGNNFTVSVVGFGAESSNQATAGDALREVVRLSKEYTDPIFRKALRKKRVSITLS